MLRDSNNGEAHKLTVEAQKLAFAYQTALDRVKKVEARESRLVDEIERLNMEIDRIKNSSRVETDSRLRAEEALDETRERLEIAVEASGLALWDFKEPFSDFYLTARWGEILQEVALEGSWSTEQLKQRVHPDDFPMIEKGLGKLMAGYISRGVVVFRFRAAQRWIWLESHGTVSQRNAAGKPICMTGTIADVTQRVENEARLSEARLLAEKNSQLKSDLIASISHDIRTPLNALMGLNSVLLDSDINKDQRHWLELMQQSTENLLKILNDLLDLSRIEAGRLELSIEPFVLKRFLDQNFGLFEQQARAKGLTYTQLQAETLPVTVRADAVRIGQVLNNLLSNAVKFTGQGGGVSLSSALEQTADSTRLTFAVRDSGIGIRPESLNKLFKNFSQADASIAGRYGGSGMGLAICARLVELMGGDIRVESKLGEGSTFFVSIPIDAVQQPAPSALPVVAPASAEPAGAAGGAVFAGVRVLLAEDQPINEMLMLRVLSSLGCDTTVAHNGLEAVAAWEQGGIDLILMDVQMPECNGMAAAERIRALERARGGAVAPVPILALTANAMQGDRDRCLAVGMDGYVTKPVQKTVLINEMKRLLGVCQHGQEKRAEPAEPSREKRREKSFVVAPASALAKAKAKTKASAAAKAPASTQAPGAPRKAMAIPEAPATDAALSQDILAMLPAILKDIQTRADAIDQALRTQDVDTIGRELHNLQSSLGYIGAARGIRLCRGLEMAAGAGEWGLFQRAQPLLHQELAQIATQYQLIQ